MAGARRRESTKMAPASLYWRAPQQASQSVSNQMPSLQTEALRQANESVPTKSRNLTISYLCVGPRGQWIWCELFLRFVLPCESQGWEPCWFSNLDVLWCSCSIGCGIQSFVPQGKTLDSEFPCTVGCSVGEGRKGTEREVSGKSVSSLLPAWMWAFSHLSHA